MLKIIIKFVVSCVGLIKLNMQILIGIFSKSKKCLIITNGLSLSGAPIVLYDVVKIYKNNGYDVFIFSDSIGKLAKKYKKLKVKIAIIPYFKKNSMKLYSKLNFNFCFINTIVNYDWVKYCSKENIPAIWWIHEGVVYIKKYLQYLYNLPLNSNIKILTVSEWTNKSLKKEKISWNTDILFYACSDKYNNFIDINPERNFTIAVIGNICERKNQNYFIEQVQLINEDIREKIDVKILGKKLPGEDEYFQEFKNLIKKNKIEYIEEISNEKMIDFYNECDLIVCCSIDDPLPVVITEGMMMKKMVLVSEETGHFGLIIDHYNGFVYSNSKKNDLSKKIVEIVNSIDERTKIEENARNTFKKFFDINSFSSRIMQITNNIIIMERRKF